MAGRRWLDSASHEAIPLSHRDGLQQERPMKVINGLVLAASLTLATIGAAHAGLTTSDQRTFPRPVQTSSVYDAQASMAAPVIANGTRAYQGGPKTGTGFAR
jgi:hypothetical protein